MILDFAKKLKNDGVSSKIIPPFGKSKFYRIAVSDRDNYADAQAEADALKGGNYGSEVWVVRY